MTGKRRLSRDELNTFMAMLRSKHFATDRDDDVAECLNECLDIHAQHQLNPLIETRGMVLLAPSGSGKSRCIERVLRRNERLQSTASILPVVSVSAPSPCTLRAVGRSILTATDYTISESVRENVVWDQVRDRLKELESIVVYIDEINNLVSTANAVEKPKIIDTLKGFLNGSWQVALILSGTLDVQPVLESDVQFARRMFWISFEDLSPEDHELISDALQDYCDLAKLKQPANLRTEIVPRLVHAGSKALGTTLEIAIAAVGLALKRGGDDLTIEHFADAYARRTGCVAPQNPFLAVRWWETRNYRPPEEGKP